VNPGLPDDVGGRRPPEVRPLPVVTFGYQAFLGRPADHPVNDDDSFARFAPGNPVGDDIPNLIILLAADNHQVATAVSGLHTVAGYDNITGGSAEEFRPEEEKPKDQG
jgi:hypothetical protein